MSNFTHIANPVKVTAIQICNVGEVSPVNGTLEIVTEDSRHHFLVPGMISRYLLVNGDYLVTQEDGYVYLNPKDVFERKYSPIEEKNE